MKIYSFEKLDVWQKSRVLVKGIYQLTETFPSEEKFGLTNQLRRAGISVASNLAEGTSRASSRDQARFTQLSYGSLMEILSQLIIATDLNYISEEQMNETRPIIEEVANKLTQLRKSQLKSNILKSLIL